MIKYIRKINNPSNLKKTSIVLGIAKSLIALALITKDIPDRYKELK